ncbi:helix-turn-helix transcriptional regulator, partial [Oxalobacteraceae bacterium OM1]
MPALPLNSQDLPTLSRSAPTKLTPPAMGAPFLARERLLERVRQSPSAKLICVQAPAGFGKTTLLRHLHDVAKTEGWTVAWLTLDANDNDLDRFMTCLGEAFARLRRVAAGTGRELRISRRRESEEFELASAIAATPMPFMLVLDEFEHLHNPAVLSVVQQMVELFGPQQRLVIGSREQPALALARLRARQQLLDIDAAQLRFSAVETEQFLCGKRHLALDAQDVERLYELTGGWAAALWLSSLALESNDNPKRFIRTFSGTHTVVASYLAEDVLSHQPPELQEFILQTSILHKFCADSCNAVTGRHDSARLIAEIERSNMLVSALDDEHTWFGYHPLFAGFLRNQLERQHGQLVPELHRRAAQWYVSQRRPTPAIDHALAAGDEGLALHLLEQHAEALFLQGRVRLLARWFDALGAAKLAQHPKLMSVYTWSLIHINRSAEALGLLEAFNLQAEASPLSQSTYLVLKTFSLFMLDRIGQTAPLWDDPAVLDNTGQPPLLRSMLMIASAYYHAVGGRYQQARLLLDKATREHGAVGPLFSVAVAGYLHGMLDLVQGQLRAAGARLRAVIGDDGPVIVRSVAPRMR